MPHSLGAASTANEVLNGRSLAGRRVLVTGASTGVGLELCRVLAGHGAEVVGAVRDVGKTLAAFQAAGIDMEPGGAASLEPLDLASLASVRACADRLIARGDAFDVVIANAGVMAVPEGRTQDGFETQFATNYLGHFLLVNRIAGLFRPGGRLVMVSSAGHRGADIDLADPDSTRTPYDPLDAYRRSKTAVILLAVEFDARNRERGVWATAVHPGAVLTERARELAEGRPGAAAAFTWKTIGQGAATATWAGLVAPADEVGGRFCEDCRVADVVDDPKAFYGVRSYALDRTRAEALWLKTEDMIGENFEPRSGGSHDGAGHIQVGRGRR